VNKNVVEAVGWIRREEEARLSVSHENQDTGQPVANDGEKSTTLRDPVLAQEDDQHGGEEIQGSKRKTLTQIKWE
jgi:hypothetical protein